MRSCEKDSNCVVCFKDEQTMFSVGECDHIVCLECSTRMRVLCKRKECPMCRQEMDMVVFLEHRRPFRCLKKANYEVDLEHGISFENHRVRKTYSELLKYWCGRCPNKPVFESMEYMKRHMLTKHDLHYCELCADNLQLFPRERRCYTRTELSRHQRNGDPDDRSHRGHPRCEFCRVRYFDNDDLYRHLRREHLFCHICDANGVQQFYSGHDTLRKHHRRSHFLCEEGACEEMHLTSVFENEIDLKAHKALVHAANRADAKRTRPIILDFAIARRNPDTENAVTLTRTVSVGERQRADQPPDITNWEHQFPSLSDSYESTMRRPMQRATIRSGVNRLAVTTENFPALGADEAGPSCSVNFSLQLSVTQRWAVSVNERPRVEAQAEPASRPQTKPKDEYPALGASNGTKKKSSITIHIDNERKPGTSANSSEETQKLVLPGDYKKVKMKEREGESTSVDRSKPSSANQQSGQKKKNAKSDRIQESGPSGKDRKQEKSKLSTDVSSKNKRENSPKNSDKSNAKGSKQNKNESKQKNENCNSESKSSSKSKDIPHAKMHKKNDSPSSSKKQEDQHRAGTSKSAENQKHYQTSVSLNIENGTGKSKSNKLVVMHEQDKNNQSGKSKTNNSGSSSATKNSNSQSNLNNNSKSSGKGGQDIMHEQDKKNQSGKSKTNNSGNSSAAKNSNSQLNSNGNSKQSSGKGGQTSSERLDTNDDQKNNKSNTKQANACNQTNKVSSSNGSATNEQDSNKKKRKGNKSRSKQRNDSQMNSDSLTSKTNGELSKKSERKENQPGSIGGCPENRNCNQKNDNCSATQKNSTKRKKLVTLVDTSNHVVDGAHHVPSEPNTGNNSGQPIATPPASQPLQKNSTKQRKKLVTLVDTSNYVVDDADHVPSKPNTRNNSGQPNATPSASQPPPGFERQPPPGFSRSGNQFASYFRPPDFEARNVELKKKIKQSVKRPDDENTLYQYSMMFARDFLSATHLYEYFRTIIDEARFDEVLCELVALLPNIRKQQELWAVHQAKMGTDEMLGLAPCPCCYQLLSSIDVNPHLASHSLQSSILMNNGS